MPGFLTTMSDCLWSSVESANISMNAYYLLSVQITSHFSVTSNTPKRVLNLCLSEPAQVLFPQETDLACDTDDGV